MNLDVFGPIVLAIVFLGVFSWGYRNGRKNLIYELKKNNILSNAYIEDALQMLANDLHNAYKESIEFQKRTIEVRHLSTNEEAEKARIETVAKARKDRFWTTAKLAYKIGIIQFRPDSYKEYLR